VAESKELVAQDLLSYDNYNDLRKDVLDTSLGHKHTGSTDDGVPLFLYGLEADRPAAGQKRRLYYATDTQKLFYDDGTSWNEIEHLPLSGGIMTGPITGITTLEADLLQIGGQEVIPSEVSGRLSFHAIETYKVGLKAHQRDAGGYSHLIFRQLKSDLTWADVLDWRALDGAEAELQYGKIPSSRLKMGSGAYAGTLAAGEVKDFGIHSHSFFPSFVAYSWGGVSLRNRYGSAGGTSGDIALYNTTGSSVDYWLEWIYLSASGSPEIWLGLEEDDRITAVWEAEDPALRSPPIGSERIIKLIKLSPTLEEFKAMRKATEGKLSTVILNEGRILLSRPPKLSFREFSFEIEIKNKEDVPRTRRVRKTVVKTVRQQVPVMAQIKVFDELTGRWEIRAVQKMEFTPQTRYRLVNPELGEASKIESYQVMVLQPIFEEKEIEVTEEIEVEEPIE